MSVNQDAVILPSFGQKFLTMRMANNYGSTKGFSFPVHKPRLIASFLEFLVNFSLCDVDRREFHFVLVPSPSG
jgi:hypothetical protein